MTGRFLALLRKDFHLMLARPAIFVFIALFAISAGALTFYTGRFFDANRADLTTLFVFFPWLFALFTPALAMEALSAERRSGTAEILHALPLPPWTIIFAKWLMLWLVCLIGLVLTMSLWISISWLGEPDHGAIIAGYFGAALMAGAMCALALAATARTASQVLAFLGALTVNVLVTVGALPVFKGLPASLVQMLADFSIPAHKTHFWRGVIAFDDVMFFVVLAAFGLFVASSLWRANRKAALRIPLAVMAVLALNVFFASGVFRAARLDMTGAQLYTLGPAARAIIAEKTTPTNWTFYYSRSLASQYPDIRSYGEQVEETLHSFADASGGKIQLTIVDPGVDNPREDAALGAGMEALPTDQGLPLYFGLVQNTHKTIARFDPARANLLEHDLARRLGVASAESPQIALYDGIDLAGRDWFVSGRKESYLFSQITEHYTINLLEPDFQATDLAGRILMLVHPPAFSDEQDQVISDFIAGGGRALVFLDPFSEVSARPVLSGLPKAGARMASVMPGALAKTGLGWTGTQIVLDRENAMPVQRTSEGQTRTLHQPAWIGLPPSHFAVDNPVTASLPRGLIVASAAALHVDPESGWSILVHASENSALMAANVFATDPNPAELMAEPPSDNTPHWLAAIKGGVIVIGDADMLDDDYYVQGDPVFGKHAQADNADFVLGALDLLAGSKALLALRTKSSPQRSLTRIDAMRQKAEQQLRQVEQSIGAEPDAQARQALRLVRQKFHRQMRNTEIALEMINIWLGPLLVILFGSMFSLWRRRG